MTGVVTPSDGKGKGRNNCYLLSKQYADEEKEMERGREKMDTCLSLRKLSKNKSNDVEKRENMTKIEITAYNHKQDKELITVEIIKNVEKM